MTLAWIGPPDWRQILLTLRNPDTYLDLSTHLVISALVILAAWAGVAAIRGLVGRTLRRLPPSRTTARRRTMAAITISLFRYLIYFLAVIAVLGTWHVHLLGLLGTALGTAGILGVVVGFGAQKLVRDLITGVFILLEDQYAVGETVTVGAITGRVEDIGVRVTRLRDDIGRVIIIPNGDISQVTNHSRGPLGVAVDLGVAFDQDLAVLERVIDGLRDQPPASPIQGPVMMQGITAMDGSHLVVRVTTAAEPGQERATEMALRSALREGLLKAEVRLV